MDNGNSLIYQDAWIQRVRGTRKLIEATNEVVLYSDLKMCSPHVASNTNACRSVVFLTSPTFHQLDIILCYICAMFSFLSEKERKMV